MCNLHCQHLSTYAVSTTKKSQIQVTLWLDKGGAWNGKFIIPFISKPAPKLSNQCWPPDKKINQNIYEIFVKEI